MAPLHWCCSLNSFCNLFLWTWERADEEVGWGYVWVASPTLTLKNAPFCQWWTNARMNRGYLCFSPSHTSCTWGTSLRGRGSGCLCLSSYFKCPRSNMTYDPKANQCLILDAYTRLLYMSSLLNQHSYPYYGNAWGPLKKYPMSLETWKEQFQNGDCMCCWQRCNIFIWDIR